MFKGTDNGIAFEDINGDILEIVFSYDSWKKFSDALKFANNWNEGKLEITDDCFSGTITVEYTDKNDFRGVTIVVSDESSGIERTVVLSINESEKLWMYMHES